MRYVFDHDYHIHSFLSDCSNDPAENTKRILEYAGQNNFVVIPTTHLHMNDLTIAPEDRNVEGRAKCWVSRLEKVLNMQLPFHKIGIELNSFDVRCTENRQRRFFVPCRLQSSAAASFIWEVMLIIRQIWMRQSRCLSGRLTGWN